MMSEEKRFPRRRLNQIFTLVVNIPGGVDRRTLSCRRFILATSEHLPLRSRCRVRPSYFHSERGFLGILESFPENEVGRELYKSPGKFGILWRKNRGQGSVPAGTAQNMSTLFRWTVDRVKHYFYSFIKNLIQVFIGRCCDWSWKVFKSDIYCNVNTNKCTWDIMTSSTNGIGLFFMIFL